MILQEQSQKLQDLITQLTSTWPSVRAEMAIPRTDGPPKNLSWTRRKTWELFLDDQPFSGLRLEDKLSVVPHLPALHAAILTAQDRLLRRLDEACVLLEQHLSASPLIPPHAN